MLGRLFKHEMKATVRLMLPAYGLILLMALLYRLTNMLSEALDNGYRNAGSVFGWMINSFFTMFFVMGIAGVMVVTLVIVVVRFYRNLIKDEGYLSFTLPVSTGQHISAKLLTSVIWMAASVVVTLLAITIYTYSPDFFSRVREFTESFSDLFEYMSNGLPVLYLVSIFVSMVSLILMIYAAIAVGQLANKHKLLVSFGVWMGFAFAAQIVSTIIMSVVSVIWFGGLDLTNLESYVFEMQSYLQTSLVVAIILQTILCVVYYVIANSILSKKLNLE